LESGWRAKSSETAHKGRYFTKMQSIPVQIGASLLRRDGKMLPHRMKRAIAPKSDCIDLLLF
jgi:hypothetical protein